MTKPTDDVETDKSCIEPLRRLAQGDYKAWQGFGSHCTQAQVGMALGGSGDDVDHYGNLDGQPSKYYIYPDTAASPHGAVVWFEEGRAVALEMHTVTPRWPIDEQLGEPQAKDPSRMPGFKTQWIYASRGLTLHIDDDTGGVAWLFAYNPMTMETYRSSWLSRVEILRHRAP
jgi:hypothetical protein